MTGELFQIEIDESRKESRSSLAVDLATALDAKPKPLPIVVKNLSPDLRLIFAGKVGLKKGKIGYALCTLTQDDDESLSVPIFVTGDEHKDLFGECPVPAWMCKTCTTDAATMELTSFVQKLEIGAGLGKNIIIEAAAGAADPETVSVHMTVHCLKTAEGSKINTTEGHAVDLQYAVKTVKRKRGSTAAADAVPAKGSGSLLSMIGADGAFSRQLELLAANTGKDGAAQAAARAIRKDKSDFAHLLK